MKTTIHLDYIAHVLPDGWTEIHVGDHRVTVINMNDAL